MQQEKIVILMHYFDPHLIVYFQRLDDGSEAVVVSLSSLAVGMFDLCRPAFGVCVCASFLSETARFCSGRRTASSVKSGTRHKETITAGATGEDGNNSALF